MEGDLSVDPDAIYVIMSNDERDDDGLSLYWSNDVGWTTSEHATRFTEEETKRFWLPQGDCFWAELAIGD